MFGFLTECSLNEPKAAWALSCFVSVWLIYIQTPDKPQLFPLWGEGSATDTATTSAAAQSCSKSHTVNGSQLNVEVVYIYTFQGLSFLYFVS